MWFHAPSSSPGTLGSRGERYFWRLQPATNFHEEGRPIQLEDTPAAGGVFAVLVGPGFALAGRRGLAG